MFLRGIDKFLQSDTPSRGLFLDFLHAVQVERKSDTSASLLIRRLDCADRGNSSSKVWGRLKRPFVFDAFPLCAERSSVHQDPSSVPFITLDRALLAFPNHAYSRTGAENAWVPLGTLRAQHFVFAFGRGGRGKYDTLGLEAQERFVELDAGAGWARRLLRPDLADREFLRAFPPDALRPRGLL